MPLRRRMDLKATACPRLRERLESVQTRMTSRKDCGPVALLDHSAELWPVSDTAAVGLVHLLAGHKVVVALGVVPHSLELGGHGKVHVLGVAGDPDV